jgi:8-oxo-dGTP pyrophosphatase MutT (NUDIX family)
VTNGTFRQVSEYVIHRGTVVTMAQGVFEGPSGERFERDIVRHPGAVVVVPLIDDETALLVRQFRAAAGRELLEVPAGKRDVDGEATEVTAGRELAEEVGRAAGRIDLLARFYNSPGFCDELTWLYLARDLTVVEIDPQGIEERSMSVEEVRLADVDGLIARGELLDAKTIIGLTLARHRVS